jgi:hypothetical protein
MNLIEQQTAAEDLPLPYLQQAVNGQNPNLAPWIATAELQRRTTMTQRMQKPQESMPTVKDQVEQKAGLMATQAAQQPEAQPEDQPEQPVMAARGGLMGARTNFRFAQGGILGYAGDGEEGSYVDPTTGVALQAPLPDDEDLTLRERITRGLGFPEEAARQKANRKALEAAEDAAKSRRNKENAPTPAPVSSAAARADDRSPRPSLQSKGIKGALPPDTPPAPRASSTRKSGIRAAVPEEAPQDPMLQKATKFINEEVPTPTPQSAIEQQTAYDVKYGLDKPIGELQQKYFEQQDALQAQRQKQAEDLAWAAYVQGLVGTPGSGALASATARANALNQAGEFQSQRAKDIASLETAQRAANEKRAAAAQGIGAAATLAASAKTTEQAKLAGEIWSSQQDMLQKRYNTDKTAETQRYVQELSMQTSNNQFNERQRVDNYNQLNMLATQLTRDEQEASTALKTLQTNPAAVAMLGKNALTDAQNYLNQIRAQKAAVVKGLQVMIDTGAKSLPAARAAAGAGDSTGAGGTTRLKFDAQGNQIK